MSRNKNDKYCLYQQRYPTRLPKLVARETAKEGFSKYSSRKANDIRGHSATDNMIDLFSKCEKTEHEKQKIMKEIEKLHLEEYLEEDEIIEPFPIYQGNTMKLLKRNERRQSLSPKNDILLQKRTESDEKKYDAKQKNSNQVNDDGFDCFNGKQKQITNRYTKYGKERYTARGSKPISKPNSQTTPKKNNPNREFIKVIKREKESIVITDVKTSLASKHFQSVSQPCKSYLIEDIICEKNKSEITDMNETRRTEEEIFTRIHTPLRIKEEEELKECWENIISDEDVLTSALEDSSSQMLSWRDADDNLHGTPISYHAAKNLRILLFGNVKNSFNLMWREQRMVFHELTHYGLRYYKDGPTELMVIIQAHVLKHLLFLNPEKIVDITQRLTLKDCTQNWALTTALSDILWKCGSRNSAVVTLPLGSCSFVGESSYIEDRITEKMELFKFTNSDELERFMRRNVRKFQESGGCISFLYSMMLSRGLKRLHADFTELQHGLLQNLQESLVSRCQALINLGIYGEAVPNVFNGETEYFDVMENTQKISKGVKRRCEIGFLAHEEFTDKKNFTVGSCLKTPLYPIWILKNNSNLGVIFSLKKELLNDWKLERRFDLYYYQGIPRHVGLINLYVRLTIDTVTPRMDDEEENSTLEETIRTKWEDALIGWNHFIRF